MATVSIPSQSAARTRSTSVLSALAGTCIGAAAASLFALLFAASAWLPRASDDGPIAPIVGVAILAPFAAGTAFAKLVGAAQGDHVGSRRSLGVGAAFVVACFLGFLGALLFESVGIRQPDAARLLLFRVAFVAGSGLVAGLSVLGATWILGIRIRFRPALAVAAATAGTYLALALLLDLVPGWHVGGGSLAMLKVATLGNFCAGFVGGALAHRLMAR